MLHRLEFHAMGCEMLAVVDGESTPSLLAKVPEWFEEWEQVLSRFRYDSELTRLNQIHEQPVQMSDTLWQVLQTARNAERLTDGLVTPTLLDAIIEAGYDRPFDVLPHETPFVSHPVLTATQPLTAIVVDGSTRTVTLPVGMSLDFGGSAKGWAAHQAMKRLQADGPSLVNAGGDIAVSGVRADGSPWQIGIANPFQREENIETLFLESCGVATSGKDRRRWTRNGVTQHHIIDPATSQPAETDLLTVTVVAPDVMQAEAAAKAAFILGSRAGLEWIEAHPQFAALFILDDGQVLYSQKMEEFL
ncbi:MAG: FAD:protein FMN transferase [Chloroflexota bacterium]|nr:FAD:protein FMN transferase [Anaerolineales bacterium]